MWRLALLSVIVEQGWSLSRNHAALKLDRSAESKLFSSVSPVEEAVETLAASAHYDAPPWKRTMQSNCDARLMYSSFYEWQEHLIASLDGRKLQLSESLALQVLRS